MVKEEPSIENNKNYQTSLKLIYYGEALDNHEIPASELSSIIKSMNDLFVEANEILNNGQAKIDINVKANFEKGSFGIDFIVIVCMLDTVKNLLTSDFVEAVLNAYEIKNIIRNLMKFIKERKGKFVSENQIRYEDDKLYIASNNENIEFEFEETNEKEEIINGDIITRKEIYKKMIKLNNNHNIRKKIEGITNIVENKGVEELKLADKYITKNIADKNNVNYFKAPNQITPDLCNNYTIETFLKIKRLAFDENSKWTMYNGETAPINATIEDKAFLDSIKSNKESFSKDDLLKVRLRVEEFNNAEKNKLTKEYFIEEVLHHQKASDNREKYFDFI